MVTCASQRDAAYTLTDRSPAAAFLVNSPSYPCVTPWPSAQLAVMITNNLIFLVCYWSCTQLWDMKKIVGANYHLRKEDHKGINRVEKWKRNNVSSERGSLFPSKKKEETGRCQINRNEPENFILMHTTRIPSKSSSCGKGHHTVQGSYVFFGGVRTAQGSDFD